MAHGKKKFGFILRIIDVLVVIIDQCLSAWHLVREHYLPTPLFWRQWKVVRKGNSILNIHDFQDLMIVSVLHSVFPRAISLKSPEINARLELYNVSI